MNISLAFVLALAVLMLTMVKNPYYFLAESRAAAAGASMKTGDLQVGMRQIDRAIALAPDVGRYHVTRAKIIDQARTAATTQVRSGQPDLEAY